MNNTLKLAAALALTGFAFSANAQGTKPMAKDAKTEEKMETPKQEAKEDKMMAKSGKKMHHGKMAHHTKMAAKSKM